MIITDQFKDVEPQSIAGPPNQFDVREGSDRSAHERNVPSGEELPPEFVPYQAEFFIDENGWIISHDAHLNEDGT